MHLRSSTNSKKKVPHLDTSKSNELLLKPATGDQLIVSIVPSIILTVDFSSETVEDGRQWVTFKVLKDCQPRIN